MKLPFRRDKNVDDVPQEIKEYYETERRDRTGIAWLLALGTLVITVGLATLLFFGGRWIYRAVANNDDNQETAQVQQNGEGTTAGDNSDSGGNSQSQDATSAPPSGTSSTSTDTPNNSSQTQGANSSSGVPSTAPNTTPTTGDDGLPRTGAGDTLALFVAVSTLGFLTHRYILSRR